MFSHGRWSSRSRDLGARSSSLFSTAHPSSRLPISLPASPRQESSPSPQPSIHPAPRPPATQRSSRRAALWSAEHSPRLQIGLSFLTPLSLCADHGPLLHCALRPWTSAEVTKNIKAAEKDKKREGGREGGRDTDRRIERGRDRDTPLSSSGAPLDSVRLDGLTDVIPPTVRALIGILSTQLLVCYTLGFFISIPSFRNTCQCRSAAARIN